MALTGCGKIFSFPQKALKTIPESGAYLRKRAREKTVENMSSSPYSLSMKYRRFSVFSDQFIAVPPRQIGIAGDRSKTALLKALALYLSSDFVQYQQCLSSSSWGIGMGRCSAQKDLLSLPVPLDHLSPEEIREWAALHDEIVKKSSACMAKEQFFKSTEGLAPLKALINKINKKVNALLGLKEEEQCLVRDFVSIRMKLNDGAIPREAMAYATKTEITAYSEILKRALDDFLDFDIRDQHRITASYSSSMVLLTIEHPEILPAGPVVVKKVDDAKLQEELKRLEKNLTVEQGQWVYFQKNLKLFQGRTTYFVKPRERLGWLQSQAFADADEFIAEKLTITGTD